MKRQGWVIGVLFAAGWATSASAQAWRPTRHERAGANKTLGIVTDEFSRAAIVFDADQDSVLGSVRLPTAFNCSDCAISPDLSLGFVVTFTGFVWVLDLEALPPVLATGVNPIPISNPGEDVVVSQDGRFLLVSDGSLLRPLSVVDIAARAEVFTLAATPDANSVDVCPDGSVLVTSMSLSTVHRLLLDGSGVLRDTEESVHVFSPNNVHCAPGGRFGLVANRAPSSIQSFVIPGLALRDSQAVAPELCLGAAFDPRGRRVFLRLENSVRAYVFDPDTGAIGARLFTRPALPTPTCSGVDQIAVHPDGAKVYVVLGPELDTLGLDGQSLGAIRHRDLRSPLAICIQREGVRR